MWDTILEAFMLLCFASAWPASIHKSWVSRTRKGKSLTFMLIILLGYLAGITRVAIRENWDFIIFPYALNTILVLTDLLLYYRNYRIDEKRPPFFRQRFGF